MTIKNNRPFLCCRDFRPDSCHVSLQECQEEIPYTTQSRDVACNAPHCKRIMS